MAELEYKGARATEGADVAYRGLITEIMAADMTAEQINAQISSALTAYATKAYVNERDALNATPSYVDAGDATRLKLSSKNIANGIPGLDANGRVSRNQIDVASGQRMPRGLWTPTSYGSPVLTTSEATLFTMAVTDPGHTYRLAVFGTLDALSSIDGAAPIIRIRVGASNGPIIATGVGTNESYDYLGIDLFNRTAANLGSGWEETWTGSGSGHVETNGSAAVYIKNGTAATRNGIFRRLGNDATTSGNYQEIEWVNASNAEGVDFQGTESYNWYWGRMSTNRSHRVGVQFRNLYDAADAKARFVYLAGGSLVNATSEVTCPNTNGSVYRLRLGTEDGARRFQLLRNGSSVLTYNDSGNATSMGSDYLGWGFQVQAGNINNFGFPVDQQRPASIDQIKIKDTAPGEDRSAYAPVVILPLAVASQTPRTGAATLYVTIGQSGTAGTVGGGYANNPQLSVLALPA